MTDREVTMNAFEFVAVASARARQLLQGCLPKVEATSAKKARVAMKEVASGAVRKEEGLRPEA